MAVIVSLGLAYFKSKSVKQLLTKKKESIYFGVKIKENNDFHTKEKIKAMPNPLIVQNPIKPDEAPKNPAPVRNVDTHVPAPIPDGVEDKCLPVADIKPVETAQNHPAVVVDTHQALKPDIIENKSLPATEQIKPAEAPKNPPPSDIIENQSIALEPHVQEVALEIDAIQEGSIPIFIETLTHRKCEILVEVVDTIEVVKKRYELKSGIPVDQQRLIFAGRELDDKRMLCDYNINRGSTIGIVLKFRGD